MYASTSSTTATSAIVTLRATIQDITAVTGDPAHDASAGDVKTAVVRFVNRDNNVTLCTATLGYTTVSDSKTATASCDWTANIAAPTRSSSPSGS
jgi:hypothetical protein